ncbi:MAG: hypothetical protein RSD13_03000 [Clostridium sp.]
MLPLEDTAEVEKKPSNPLNNEAEVQKFMFGLGVKDANRALKEIKGEDDSYKFSDYQLDTLKQNAIEGARIIADMEKYAIRGLNIGDYILGKKPTLFAKELENVENIEKELVDKHKEIQERQNIYANDYGKWGKVGLTVTDMVQNVFLDPSDYVFGVATGISKATRMMAKLPFIRYVYNQYDVYERTPIDYDYNDAKQVGIMAGLTGLKFIPSAYNHFKNKSTTGAKAGTVKDTKFLEWIDGKDKGFYPSPLGVLSENLKRINYDKAQERELAIVDTDYMRSIAFREDNNLPLSIYSNDAVKATSANINDTFEVYFMKVKEWQDETGEKDFPSFNDFKNFVEQVDKDYPLPLRKSIDKGTFTEEDYNNIIEQVTGYKTQVKQENEQLSTFRGYLEHFLNNKEEALSAVKKDEDFAGYEKDKLIADTEESINNVMQFLELGEAQQKEYLEKAKANARDSDIWSPNDKKTFFQALEDVLDYDEYREKGLDLNSEIILVNSLFTKNALDIPSSELLRGLKLNYTRATKDDVVISIRKSEDLDFSLDEIKERNERKLNQEKQYNFFTFGNYKFNLRVQKNVNSVEEKTKARENAKKKFSLELSRVVLTEEQEIEEFLADAKRWNYQLDSKEYDKEEVPRIIQEFSNNILSVDTDLSLDSYFRSADYALNEKQTKTIKNKIIKQLKEAGFKPTTDLKDSRNLWTLYNDTIGRFLNEKISDRIWLFDFSKSDDIEKQKQILKEVIDNSNVEKMKEIFHSALAEVDKQTKVNIKNEMETIDAIKDLQGAIEIPQAEATKILNVSNKNFNSATKRITDVLTQLNDYYNIKSKDIDATDEEIDNLIKNDPFIILAEKSSFASNKILGIVKGINGKYHVIRKSVLADSIAGDFDFPNLFEKESIVSIKTPLILGDGVDKPSQLFDDKYMTKYEQRKLRKSIAKGTGHGEGNDLILSSIMSYVDYLDSIHKYSLADKFRNTAVQIFGKDSEEYKRIELNKKVPYWVSTAIQNYNNGSFYRNFNQKVIDGNYKAMDDRELQTLRNFEEYFATEKPLEENMVFYRGFRLQESQDSWFDEVVKNLRVGDIMGNRSYLSASHTPFIPTYFADIANKHSRSYFMNIEVPKGTVVLPFGQNANFTAENEVLLNKDNAFYIKDIKEVEYYGQKVKIIDAILIDGDYKEFLSKDDKRPYYRVDAGKQLFIKRHMQGMELPFEFELNNLILKNASDIESAKEVLKYYKNLTEIRKDEIMKALVPIYDKIREIRRKNDKLDGIKILSIIRKNLSKKLFYKYGITDSKLGTLEAQLREAYEKGGELTEEQIRNVASGIIYRDLDRNIESIFKENAEVFNKFYNNLSEAVNKDYENKIADFNEEKINEKINGFNDLKKFVEEKTNLLGEGGKVEDTSSNAEVLDYKKALWYITKDNFLNTILNNIDFGLSFVRSDAFAGTGIQGSAMRNGKNIYMLVNTDSSVTNNKPLFPVRKPFNTVTVDTSKTGIIIHELGHVLDYYLDDGTNKNTGYFILANAFKEHGLDLYAEAKSGALNYLLSDYARMGISGFENNPNMFARESFAEAFNLAFNPNTVFFDELQQEIMTTFKKGVIKAFKWKLEEKGKPFKFENGEFIYNKLEVPSPRYKYFEETDSSKIDLTNEKIKADSLYMKKNGIPFEKTSLGNAGVRLPKIYSDLRDGLVPDIKSDALIIDYGAGVGWKEQFKLREEAGIKNNVIPYDKYADEKIGDWTPVEDAIRKAKGEGKDVVIISSNVLNVIPIKEIFGENKDGAYVEDLVKEIERLANEYDVKAVITVYEGEPKNKYKPAIMGTGTYQSNMPLAYYTKFFDDKSKLSVGKYILYDPNKKHPSEFDINDSSYGKVVGGNRYKYIGNNQILVTDAKTNEYKFVGIVDDWNGKFEPTIIKFDYPDGKFKVPSINARQVYHSKHLFVSNPNAPQYQLSKARAEKIDSELKRLDISKKAIGYETKWQEYLKQMNLDDEIETNFMIFKGGAGEAKKAKIKEKKKEIKKVKATFKNLNRNEELKVDVFETLKDEDKIRYMDYFNMQFNVKPLKTDIKNYNASLNKAYRDIIATRASAGGAFWSSSALKELIPMQDGESYLFGKVDVQNTNIRYKDKSSGEQRQKTLKSDQLAYIMSQEKNGKRHLRVYHMSNDNKFEFVEEIDGTMRTLSGRKEEEYYKKIEKNVEILEESEAVKIEKERVPANEPVTISGNLEKDYTNVINNLNNLTKKLVDQDNADKVGIDVPLSVRNILRPMRYHFNNIVRYKAYDIKQKLWGDTRFNQILDKKRMVNLKAQLSSKGLIEAMQQNKPLNIEGVNPEFVQNLRALWERAVQFKSKDTGVALDNEDFYMGIDTFYNKNLFQSQLFKLKEGAIDADLKAKLLENLKEEFVPMLEEQEFLKQFFVDHTKTNRDKNGNAYLNHADIADYYYKDRQAYVSMYDGMEREIDDILGNIIKNAMKEEISLTVLDNLKTVAYAKFDSEDAGKLASIDSKTKLEISKEVDYLKYDAGRIIARNVATSKEIVEDYNSDSKIANAFNKNPLAIMIHDFMAWKYLASLNYLAEAPLNSREVHKGLRDYGIISNAEYLGKSFNYVGQYADMLKTHFHFIRGLKQLKDDDVMQVDNLKDRELMRIYLNQKMMNEKDYSDFSKLTQFNHKLGMAGGSGQGFSDLQRKLLAEWSLYKAFGKGLNANIEKEKMKGLLGVLGIDETRFRDIQTTLNVIDKDYLYELLFEKGEGDSEIENDIKRLFNNIVEDAGKDFDLFNRATGLEEHIMTKLLLMYKRYSLRMSTKIWRENTTTMDDDGIIYDNTRAGFKETFTAEHWADNAVDMIANTNFAFNRGLGKIAIALIMGAIGLGTTTYFATRSMIDGFINGDYFAVTRDLAMANLVDNAGITTGFGGSTPIGSFITNIPYRYKIGMRAGLGTSSTMGYMALATISPEVVARSIDLYSLKRNMPSNITTSSEKASFAYKSIYKQDGKRAQMKYDVPPLFLFIPRATGAIFQLMLKDDDLSSKASGIYDDSVDKNLKASIATDNLVMASEVARNHAVAILPSEEIDKLGIGYEEELKELSSSMRDKYIKVVDYLGLDEKQRLIVLHKLNDFNTEQEKEDFLMDQVPKNKRENF